jgi:hypothetical protein
MYHDGWNLSVASSQCGSRRYQCSFSQALGNALNGTRFGTKSQLVEAAKLVERSRLRVGEQAVEPI